MLTIKKSFQILNWKLLLAILLTLLFPALYELFKVYFVGEITDTYAFTIAGNLNWIDVIFEVLEEAFLLPLFFVLNKLLQSKNSNAKIIGMIYAISLIYLIFIVCSVIFTRNLLKLMSTNLITNEVITFVKVELAARFLIMTTKLITIFLIAKEKWRTIILLLFFRMTTNFLLDFFLISNNDFSLKLGIVWIALNQLFITFLTTIIGIIFVIKTYQIKWRHFIRPQISLQNNSWKQNLWNGAESFFRNAFFIYFVLIIINRLPNQYSQGDFWVMNKFIWSLLLLPVLAISQYVNRNQAFAQKTSSLKERLVAPFILITFVIALWFISIPTWPWFIKTIMNNPNYQEIAYLVLISIGFYTFFAYNNVIDKTFLGSGKAHLLFAQSVITNVVVFIPYYYLVKITNLEDIAIMMGLAILVDTILTFAMFGFYISKRQLLN